VDQSLGSQIEIIMGYNPGFSRLLSKQRHSNIFITLCFIKEKRLKPAVLLSIPV
jgi:hypothetical protein